MRQERPSNDGDSSTERRLSERFTSLEKLRLAITFAPAITQLFMAVFAIMQHQWILLAMIVPNLLGSLLYAITAVSRLSKHDQSQGIDRDSTTTTAQQSRLDSASPPSFATIESISLEAALALNRQEDPVLWRSIILRWLKQPTIPLGTDKNGIFTLDLRTHGPHALIAGTTGSGKSVLLRSWCLAYAATIPPDRLHFIFLDFKGGAAFNALASLPHTAGLVCDLNLKHATRALLAIESELQRREQLVAQYEVTATDDLENPPPTLIIVIDEYHALRGQLPDYMDRLSRIASLGRSLGMHIILCTQNPLAQVGTDIKANMAIHMCLRVRDALQSNELIGSSAAAMISPTLPGAGFCHDGEVLHAIRCAMVDKCESLVLAIKDASAMAGIPSAKALFTPPLPHVVKSNTDLASAVQAHGNHNDPIIALGDDGMCFHEVAVPLCNGNLAIIGQRGRGKSTVLATLRRRLKSTCHPPIHSLHVVQGEWHKSTLSGCSSFSPCTSHNDASHRKYSYLQIWLIDDADPLFDPYSTDPLSQEIRHALQSPDSLAVVTAQSSRHIRLQDHFPNRILFPTGDRSTDLINGIPANMIAQFDKADLETPGRAVLIHRAQQLLIQCPYDGDEQEKCKSFSQSS
ncbi:FtsK/SpoIIIE domain-containing protein [Bifidobacterium tsurumiense]|nr:FtsK/SpoIIIE domain-containing protein [Bifidobacterium tsurumiense]MSS12817.1 hypothetical protein [Bifidobacterium tsurumiense]